MRTVQSAIDRLTGISDVTFSLGILAPEELGTSYENMQDVQCYQTEFVGLQRAANVETYERVRTRLCRLVAKTDAQTLSHLALKLPSMCYKDITNFSLKV